MKLAIGIICLWMGSALLWVSSHGLAAGAQGVGDAWKAILSGIGGGQ